MNARELDRSRFSRLAALITRELGIRMPPAKVPMLETRLQRRLRELGLRSVEDYERYLFDPAHADHELVHFLDLATTNKTDFFREPQHLDYLVDTALPTLRAKGASDHCRLWSAGCSTGQEAYTLAIVLAEYALRDAPGFSYSILATDVSQRALDQARTATYAESQLAPIALELRKRHLLRSKDRRRALVRIAPQLRAKVRFARLNFMDREYRVRDEFDVIFFRNVMIYFDKPTQEAVMQKLCRNLRQGGYVFIGHSESLAGLDLPLKAVANSVFRKVR
jgi:chemotaxis protein methyltransferase CheR